MKNNAALTILSALASAFSAYADPALRMQHDALFVEDGEKATRLSQEDF